MLIIHLLQKRKHVGRGRRGGGDLGDFPSFLTYLHSKIKKSFFKIVKLSVAFHGSSRLSGDPDLDLSMCNKYNTFLKLLKNYSFRPVNTDIRPPGDASIS
jgi:hypothetical protein